MVTSCLAAFFAIFGSHAAPITVNEPESWKTSAVVYAEVSSVANGDNALKIIGLTPIAVLTGNFDAAFEGPTRTTVDIGSHSSIEEAPKVGAKVLVFVSRSSDAPAGSMYQTHHSIYEMPGTKGIVEVTGFDDPKITQTIEKLRKLRALHREGKRGPTIQELMLQANEEFEKKKANDSATKQEYSKPQAEKP